jgi:cytochrome c oxidase cbb3-type subunit 3
MLKHVTGVEVYLIFSLFVFIAFFVAMVVWLFFIVKKNQIEQYKNVPFTDGKDKNPYSKVTLFLLLAMGTFISPIYAQDKPSITVNNQVFFEGIAVFLIVISIFLALLILAVGFQLLTILYKATAKTEEEKNLSIWQVILGLKPISKEKSLILPEKYDGIAELDNPVPVWFNALFGVTIVFAVGYMLIYHVWKGADLQDDEYVKEVQYASVQKEAYLKKIASLIDENNVKQVKDKKALEEGMKIYKANCASCHGEKGEGGIGPNLTDNYWLHGGKITEIFKTIKKGVPSKGMISWEKKLNPLQIQNTASYIMTLQGTNPPNAKEPQGEKLAVNVN